MYSFEIIIISLVIIIDKTKRLIEKGQLIKSRLDDHCIVTDYDCSCEMQHMMIVGLVDEVGLHQRLLVGVKL